MTINTLEELAALPTGTQLRRDSDPAQVWSVTQMDGGRAMVGADGVFPISDLPPWLFHMGPLEIVHDPTSLAAAAWWEGALAVERFYLSRDPDAKWPRLPNGKLAPKSGVMPIPSNPYL